MHIHTHTHTHTQVPATSKPAPPRADKKALDKAVGALQADVEKINEEIAGYDKQIEEVCTHRHT